mmetsp:Transcript_5890/g.13695  ORF Transcript_5890/g.13695 Transcript_5890/m.13695 type:complete len:497 (+) Transcript_5890:214-1704(+)
MSTAVVRCTTADEYATKWIEKLNQKAEVQFDHTKPLDKWLKSANMLYNQASVQLQEGTEETMKSYYVLMLRYVDLICNEIPQHPGYSNKATRAEHKKMLGTVNAALEELETAKAKLKKHYEAEFNAKIKEITTLTETRKRERAAQDAKAEREDAAIRNRLALDMERQAEMEARAAALSNRQPANVGVGDQMLRDSWQSLPPHSWPHHPAQGPSSPSPSSPKAGLSVSSDDDLMIGVPVGMDSDPTHIPVLLPRDNRMTWDTFQQLERRQPNPAPRPVAPPPSASVTSVNKYERDLQEALRISALETKHDNSKMDRLKERLEKYTEYELEDVDNSGHCQFDAIAHQIAGRFPGEYSKSKGGARYHFRDVRRDVAMWLRQNATYVLENGEQVQNFLDETDGRTWAEFCDNVEDKMHNPQPLWGNHLTLIAAANCYQRPIRVWSTAPGDDWWLQIDPKHYKPKHRIRPFELAHLYERHYMSVRERKGATGISARYQTPK